jgi:hypothetical protein
MADYSVDTNLSGGLAQDVELRGLDDMRLATQSALTSDSKVASDSKVTSESKLTSSSAVTSDSSVRSEASLALAPVTTTATLTLTPLTTSTSVDLKPVAVDSCIRLELAPPPPTEVCTPYEHRWGWAVLGLELFSLTVSGHVTTHVRPERPRPLVVDL